MIINPMVHQYIRTALLSSTDNNGIPLGRIYSINDLSPETLTLAKITCDTFIKLCEKKGIYISLTCLEHIGHNFWLIRNKHTTGFWNANYYPKDIREQLTEITHSFGECTLYIGDNNQLYFSHPGFTGE